MKKAKTKPKLSASQFDSLLSALDEIADHFSWVGFSVPEPEADGKHSGAVKASGAGGDGEEADDSGDDDEDYTDFFDGSSYERAEIEIAVDNFLSCLITDRVIPKRKSKGLPQFHAVFERIFGEDHDITLAAIRFEEYAEGYFDTISYESMRDAFGEFVEIVEAVRQEKKSAYPVKP
jgi:hypothetical protein